ENKRENYLCKHNNIKYKGLGTEGYIDVTRVQACKIPENKSFWKGKRVYVGLDLSLSEDNVAVALVTMHNGKLYAKVWGFVPTDRVLLKSKRESVDYNRLIDSGVCIACGDEVVDYSTIEDFIMHLEQELGVEIVQIGYDRWNAVSTVQKLEAAGHECVEIKQHSSVLHMPTKYLKEQILSGNFAYEPNQMLEINFQNARCTEDTNLNKYVNKKKSNGKVDMVVALINAVYLQQQELLYGNTFTFQFI
ncbi:MAG: terminase, partial [Peptococcaceae bacterium]|nr:terminase [Peptococcaceae bacterium]